MARYCANLSLLFTEVPFLDRFAAARAANFSAVEALFPYDLAAEAIREQLLEHELSLALINCPPPRAEGEPAGFAATPAGEDHFRQSFREAQTYAEAVGAEHLHIMAGVADGSEARRTFVANLQWAANHAPQQSLTIEPLNPVAMPGYFLNDFDEALSILEEVNRPNVRLQYDSYHAQMITGDALAIWEKVARHTAHVQVGGVPGRHEPHVGDIDYPALLRAIGESGYAGWISGEYHPRGRTEDGLGWRL